MAAPAASNITRARIKRAGSRQRKRCRASRRVLSQAGKSQYRTPALDMHGPPSISACPLESRAAEAFAISGARKLTCDRADPAIASMGRKLVHGQ